MQIAYRIRARTFNTAIYTHNARALGHRVRRTASNHQIERKLHRCLFTPVDIPKSSDEKLTSQDERVAAFSRQQSINLLIVLLMHSLMLSN
jgi:hypothetical protein